MNDDRAVHIELAGIARRLGKITTVEEAKDFANKAAAIKHYAKNAQWTLPEQNRIAFMKLCFQRKAGELLRAMLRGPRGGAQSGRGEKHSFTHGECLKAVGISWTVAAEWELLANLSVDDLAAIRDECDDNGRELTRSIVMRNLRSLSANDYAESKRPWEHHWADRAIEKKLQDGVNAIFRCSAPFRPPASKNPDESSEKRLSIAENLDLIEAHRERLTGHTRHLLADDGRMLEAAGARLRGLETGS
jgi:hypothetical protein